MGMDRSLCEIGLPPSWQARYSRPVTADQLQARRDAGPHATTPRPKIDLVLDVRQAIRGALERAEPGDLIVVGCASHLSDFKTAVEAAGLGHKVRYLAHGETYSFETR